MNGMMSIITNDFSLDSQLNKAKNSGVRIKEQFKRVNNETEKQREFRQVAKEMESLFAFQLLKVMRETSQALSEEKKGFGNSTYMSLFDIEVSKMMAERGLGLQEAIINWLERLPDAKNARINK